MYIIASYKFILGEITMTGESSALVLGTTSTAAGVAALPVTSGNTTLTVLTLSLITMSVLVMSSFIVTRVYRKLSR